MNDFDYDCLEKKRVARSANNHVNRRRGRCKLPHEYMSRKELNAMNGECVTVNVSRPITWEEFKALPKSLQQTYYNHLSDEYGANMRMIAKMMGTCDETLRLYIIRTGLDVLHRPKGYRPSREQMFRWHEFLRGDEKQPGEEQPVEETPVEQPVELPLEPYQQGGLGGYSLMFLPGTTWADIMRVLEGMPIPDGAYIKVLVE